MENYRNVMVYGEIIAGQLTGMTKELLGGARQLSDEMGEELIAVFIGDGISEPARQAYTFGADRICTLDDMKFHYYQTDHYVFSMEKIVKKEQPRFVLLGHTDAGADLGPRLSFRLGVPITTDCVTLEIDPETKHLLATKPVYGGLAMATFGSDGFPQIATVRAKSLSPAQRKDAKKEETEAIDVSFDGLTPRVEVLEKIVEEVEGIRLAEADLIVSGGRGIGGPEGFKVLEDLARLLKGAVGASRVPCDSGWVPSAYQVGLTGTIVAPSLYVAVGISGASQHMTGCAHAKTVVSINTDPNAPIFREAQYGVVGDWKVILPAFIEKIKSME